MASAIHPGKLAPLFSIVLLPRTSLACPDCPPVRQARATILHDPHMWTYIASVVLPFLVIGIVAAMVYRIGKPRAVPDE